MTTFNLLTVPGLGATTPAFREALVQLSLEKGYDPNLVAAVISFESGFNPAAKNPHSGATGLIQWMPTIWPGTAAALGSSLPFEQLAQTSALQQLPAVFAFLDGTPLKKRQSGATPTDYYLAVFSPAFIGASSSTLMGRKNSKEILRLPDGRSTGKSLGTLYAQNGSSFDTTGKGEYTIADIGRRIESLVSEARRRPPTAVPLAQTSSGTLRSPVDLSPPSSLPPPLPSPSGSARAPSPPGPPRPAGSRMADRKRLEAGGLGLEVGSGSEPQAPSPKPGSSKPSEALGWKPQAASALPKKIGALRTLLRDKATTNLPALAPGSHGPAVRVLQRLLLQTMPEGEDRQLIIDGDYGVETELWVALHQQDLDLGVSGVCNAETWLSFSKDELWGPDRTLPGLDEDFAHAITITALEPDEDLPETKR